MESVTISLDPDEFLGLTAVLEVTRTADGAATAQSTAKSLLHGALAARLDELGLPWAPSAGQAQDRAAKEAVAGLRQRLLTDRRVRTYGGTVLLVATLVALWGGYVLGWSWTGFRANDQVWAWLHLLLLPVVVGTIPLWIQHGDYMSRARRVAVAVSFAAFAGFVIAGYLIPLKWTGFPGNTVWSWFQLILLPAALVSFRAWPSAGRPVRMYHKAMMVLLGVGWVITVIGGYAADWTWTGYQGNTLWDWLQLLLLPLVFPTVLLPAALTWITGNAERRHEEALRAAKAAQGGDADLSPARS